MPDILYLIGGVVSIRVAASYARFWSPAPTSVFK